MNILYIIIYIFKFFSVRLTVEDRPMVLQLVDTAGQVIFYYYINNSRLIINIQNQFEMIRRLSYPDAEIFILCFNICDPESFRRIRDKWAPELREYCPKVPVVLVGTQARVSKKIYQQFC